MYIGHYVKLLLAPCQEKYYVHSSLFWLFGEPILKTGGLPPKSTRNWRLRVEVGLGRHRAVSMVWTAQRMSEVARRLTSATDRFFLFRHTEPIDIDAIWSAASGDCASAAVRRLAQSATMMRTTSRRCP